MAASECASINKKRSKYARWCIIRHRTGNADFTIVEHCIREFLELYAFKRQDLRFITKKIRSMSYNLLGNNIEISNLAHSQVYENFFETLAKLIASLSHELFW